jgi:hypothetical protein
VSECLVEDGGHHMGVHGRGKLVGGGKQCLSWEISHSRAYLGSPVRQRGRSARREREEREREREIGRGRRGSPVAGSICCSRHLLTGLEVGDIPPAMDSQALCA